MIQLKLWRTMLFIIITLLTAVGGYAQTNVTMKKSTNSNHWVENKDLSIEDFIYTENNINNNKDTIEQITSGLLIIPSFIDNQNTEYITSENNTYKLRGILKENKPFGGFFLNSKALRNTWVMIDFYENGILKYQLYSDGFKIYKHDELDEDSKNLTKTLSEKNIFSNNILTNGVELSYDIYTHEDFQSQVVRYVKDGHTDYFEIGLFSINYGEFVKIKPQQNIYVFDSYQKDKVKITYSENGRKIEFFNNNNQLMKEIDCKHFAVEDQDTLKDDGVYTYFINNGKIYIETSSTTETATTREQGSRSDILPRLVNNFYFTFREIMPNEVYQFSRDLFWNNNQTIGAYSLNNGTRIGSYIKKGKSDNLYNFYFTDQNGKTETLFEDKKLDEMTDLITNKFRELNYLSLEAQ